MKAKMKKHILLLKALFLLMSFSSIVHSTETQIVEKIKAHYKNNFFTAQSDTSRSLRVYKIARPYIGKLYLVLDFSSPEAGKMVYAYSEDFLYPIYNIKTYNAFIRTSGFYVSRHNVMGYFKMFLKLQQLYSKNKIYTEIDKQSIIKKYAKYGKKGFKKRVESYYVNEPDIKAIRGKPLFYVSLPTFTLIGRLYFRFRVTRALINETGVIEKIWGYKPVYFIYNGEIAPISAYQLKRFESSVY